MTPQEAKLDVGDVTESVATDNTAAQLPTSQQINLGMGTAPIPVESQPTGGESAAKQYVTGTLSDGRTYKVEKMGEISEFEKRRNEKSAKGKTPDFLQGIANCFYDNNQDTLSMRRAFPAYKFYIYTDELKRLEANIGKIIPAYGEFFEIKAIRSIRLIQDEDSPADTLIIEILDPFGVLNNYKMSDQWNTLNSKGEMAERSTETLDKNTKIESDIKSIMLRQGVPCQLRFGYGADPMELPLKFNGTVMEIQRTEGGSLVTVVAQGYGYELLQDIKMNDGAAWTFDDDEAFTGNIISRLLCEPELVHLGRVNPYTQNESGLLKMFEKLSKKLEQNKKTLGESLLGKMTNWFDALIDDAQTAQEGWDIENSHLASYSLVDDNIFAPVKYDWLMWKSYDDSLISGWFDNARFGIYKQTIWEVIKELELRHPGWVSAVVPYENRSTVFFGLPDFNYRARADRPVDSQLLSEEDYLKTIRRYGRPIKRFRNYFLFTSSHHIVANKIKVSAAEVFNSVKIQYKKGDPFFDEGFDINNDRAERTDWFFDDGDMLEVSYDVDMKAEDKRTLYVMFENVATQAMAGMYATSLLAKSIANMYTGSFIVLGCPDVKPHDICYIADFRTDMMGPVAVKRVVHIMSPEEGFISEIYPKAVVGVNEWVHDTSLETMCNLMSELTKKLFGWDTDPYESIKGLGKNAPKTIGTAAEIVAGGTVAKALVTAAGEVVMAAEAAGTSLAAAWSTPATVSALALAALYGGYKLYQYVGLTRFAQPIIITPLIIGGKPILGGIPDTSEEKMWYKLRNAWKAVSQGDLPDMMDFQFFQDFTSWLADVHTGGSLTVNGEEWKVYSDTGSPIMEDIRSKLRGGKAGLIDAGILEEATEQLGSLLEPSIRTK